ncbi:MAG: DUF3488 domain-containing protein [Myxococcales bacterium]|nr:DUF3488 domain-containing protein [Myxococcales bacterium]
MSAAVERGGLRVGRLRRGLVFAMNGIAYFALAATGDLSIAASVLFVVALVSGWFWDAPRVRFERWATGWTVLTLAAFGLTVLQMITDREFVLTSAMYFGIFLAAAKLFQLAEDKDYTQSMALSLLLLAAASVVNDRMSFGLSFGVYVLLSTVALTAHHLCFELTAQRGRAGWSTRVERPLMVATMSLATLVLAGSMLFFFAFPRIGFGLFVQNNRAGDSSGFSEGVELNGGGIEADTSVVMRVKFLNFAPNAFQEVYFRGLSLDHYDGRAWRDDDDREATVTRDVGGRGYVLDTTGATWEAVTANTIVADIYLEPIDSSVLFAPGSIRAIGLPDDVVSDDDRLFGRYLAADATGEVNLHQRSSQGVMYRVYADPHQPNDDELAAARWPGGADSFPDVVAGAARASALPDAPLAEPIDIASAEVNRVLSRSGRTNLELAQLTSHYLQLPANLLSPRIQELLARLRAGARTRHEFVRAVEAHLQRMDYDANLPPSANPNVVDEFLFDWQRGSCGYFATAMVVLLRAEGIPARVVNGYMGAEPNTVGGYYVVRQSNAHSWVEVYYPELGWVRFDPTPAQPGALSATGMRRRLNELVDNMRLQWFRWVVEYDLEKQYTAARGVVAALSGEDSAPALDNAVRERLQAIGIWLWRHGAAITLHTFLWLCGTSAFRWAYVRRRRWGLFDNTATVVWIGAALAVSARFWPGGLTRGGIAVAIAVPIVSAAIAWVIRRVLFDDESKRERTRGSDTLSALYTGLIQVADEETDGVPLAITPEELLPTLDLRDPQLAAEVAEFLSLYLRVRYGGVAVDAAAVERWRARTRPLLRAVARDLRAQMAEEPVSG